MTALPQHAFQINQTSSAAMASSMKPGMIRALINGTARRAGQELRHRGDPGLDIGIVEPADVHYYQTAFTLVCAGAYSLAATLRDEAPLIPPAAPGMWCK